MASLAEHITVFETELATMTLEGHHADRGVRAVMDAIDTACYRLNQCKRELKTLKPEDTHDTH